MTATTQVRRADIDGFQLVMPEKIVDNPWQPRGKMDPDGIKDLADSIAEEGLLQPPFGRPTDGGVELAFGHRRVAAVRLLIEQERWEGGIPMIIRDLEDRDMLLHALAENDRREDISRLDELKAYDRALGIEGITKAELARRVGIDRSTMSHNLEVLKLPAFVLDRVDSGEMSIHAAREFLALRTDNHEHPDEMNAAIKEILDVYRGRPDWRVSNVRTAIRNAIGKYDQDWRPLESGITARDRDPGFDVTAFVEDFGDQVHRIPALEGTKSHQWTCNVTDWRRLQTAATRAMNVKAKEQGVAPPHQDGASESRESRWRSAILMDPLLLEFREVAGIKRKKPDLSDDEVEILGTRAVMPAQTSSWENKDFAQPLVETHHEMPPGFDLEECRRCIAGAIYQQIYKGENFILMCGDQAKFNAKKSRSISAFKVELEKQKGIDEVVDTQRVEDVKRAMPSASVARAMALTLVVGNHHNTHSIEPITPAHPKTRWAYWPASFLEALDLLGVELVKNPEPWESPIDIDALVEAIEDCPEGMIKDVAARLLVHRARIAPGVTRGPERIEVPASNGAQPAELTINGESVFDVLAREFPVLQAQQLYGFVFAYRTQGRDWLKRETPKSTFYDQLASLRGKGIEIADLVDPGDRGESS